MNNSYVEANLNGTQYISQILIRGTEKYYESGKNPYKGMRIQLLDSNRNLQQEFISRYEANLQTYTFCTDLKNDITAAEAVGPAAAATPAATAPVNKTVVAVPSSISCSQVTYPAAAASIPSLSQWLCASQAAAMTLIQGPTNSSQTYLKKGDEICIQLDDSGKKYSCYEPYSPEKKAGDYRIDTTAYDMLDTNKEACDIIMKSSGDLTGSLETIGKMGTTASTNLTKLQKAENDLSALYSSMNCSDTMPLGRPRNMCVAIKNGLTKIQAERAKVQGLNTKLSDPATASATARASLDTLATQFGCLK